MLFLKGKDKPGIIVQARMGSTRLPGKVAKNIVDDTPMLEYQLKRLRLCRPEIPIYVATPPDLVKEKPIHDICRKLKIPFYAGSEHDLIRRYLYGAKKYDLDPIIRITSDCPLLDPTLIEEAYGFYRMLDVDYYTNSPLSDGKNVGYPSGMNVEIIKRKTLELLDETVSDKSKREHCTLAIQDDLFAYSIGVRKESLWLGTLYSNYDFSVDTIEDFEYVRSIAKAMKKDNFKFEDILSWNEKV